MSSETEAAAEAVQVTDSDVEDGFALDTPSAAASASAGRKVFSLKRAARRANRRRAEKLLTQQRRLRDIATALSQTSDLRENLVRVAEIVRELTGCKYVGIRLRDHDDFPYFVSLGFSQDHLDKENSLWRRAQKAGGDGVPAPEGAPLPKVMDCMCGNVLLGITDPTLSCFTPHGSFWTPDVEREPVEALGSYACPIRGTCMCEGFKTMAMVPIRMPGTSDPVGLLHVNDIDRDRHDAEQVELLETVAAAIGIAVRTRYQAEKMREALSMTERMRSARTILTEAAEDSSDEDLDGMLGSIGLEHYAIRLRDAGIRTRRQLKYADLTDLVGTLSMSAGSAQRLMLEGEEQALRQLTISGVSVRRKIGEGSFGAVYEGTWGSSFVACKTIRKLRGGKSVGIEEKGLAMVREMLLHSRLAPHPNVISFFGVTTINNRSYMVTELAAGCALTLVRTGGCSPANIVEVASGTAAGMKYLASVGVIHGDLALRNILYRSDPKTGRIVAKISDFGLSTIAGTSPQGGEDLLPVRWSAPEVLKAGVTTTASDVWSFGVVLWELWSNGKHPFDGVSNTEVASRVADGSLRLERPAAECPDAVWELIQACWRERSDERPTFDWLLGKLLPLHPKHSEPVATTSAAAAAAAAPSTAPAKKSRTCDLQ